MADARADDAPQNTQPPDKAALTELGRSFIQKVGGDLDEANLYLKGAGKLELAQHKAGTVLPDNEPLILHAIIVGDDIDLNQDLYSIKRGHILLVSLGDFIQATGLHIKLDSDKGTASGWFVRQTRTFTLDVDTRIVTIQGKSQAIAANDMVREDGQVLVSAEMLAKWFDLDFDYDFAGLALLIKTKDPLPAQAAWQRSQRKAENRYKSGGAPELPYMEQPYGLISQPYIDTNINGTIIHTPHAPPQKSANWSTIMNGDFAGFSGQAFLSGSDQTPYIDTARITLGKEDVKGKLLGPLHATKYSFGDINTASATVIGGGALEQGVYVTNKPINGTTTQTSTEIRGTAKVGWDVELYRNNTFLDIRHIGTNGIYDFGTVDLQYGDNDFKFLFYGPQGETYEDHRHVGVNARAVSSAGTYTASVSRRGVNTIQTKADTTSQGPDYGTLHEVATYERGLGNIGTVNLGANSFTRNGEKKMFGQAGLATYQLGAFLNADVGVDAANGATSAVVTARRNFGKQAVTFQYTRSDREYNSSPGGRGLLVDQNNTTAGGGAATPLSNQGDADQQPESATKQVFRLNLTGPLINQWLPKNPIYYGLSASHLDRYNGTSINIGGFTLSSRLGPASLSGGFSTQLTTTEGGETTQLSQANFNGHMPLFGGSLRMGSSYQIKPDFELRSHTAEYDHSIAPNLDSTTTVIYTPRPALTTLQASLNWRTRYALLSPRVSIDSHQNAAAGLDVHFAMGADPYSHMYGVYGSYLTGVGGVAARIFEDKNGDGAYDKGDELLPEATLIAVQPQRSAVSSDKGIAFIPDLPANAVTDVTVDPTSSANAYGISMFKGVSIRPHPGAVLQLEFPIVEGGEMDGQADFAPPDGTRTPARGATMSLVAPDGHVEKTAQAASDGYWSLSGIRPGAYYLTAETGDAQAGFIAPRMIEFNVDGTTLFGQPVLVSPGRRIPVKFSSDNEPPDGPNHARTIRLSDIISQKTKLELGDFKSKLALDLAWYRIRLTNPQWATLFDPETPLAKIAPDKTTGLFRLILKPKQTMAMNDAFLACRALQAEKLTCQVDVMTHYKKYTPPAEVQNIAFADMLNAPKPRILPKSVVVMSDFKDYEQRNPIVAKALDDQSVVLNFGSYNSREMMIVVWYKLKKKYGSIIGPSRLLVQPADSFALAKTGKHVLRAVLSGADFEEGTARCNRLKDLGQPCTVEAAPEQPRQVSVNGATTFVHAGND